MNRQKPLSALVVLSLSALFFSTHSEAEVLKAHYKNPSACPQISYLGLDAYGWNDASHKTFILEDDQTETLLLKVEGKRFCGVRDDVCPFRWTSSSVEWDVTIYDQTDDGLGENLSEYTIRLDSKRNSGVSCKWNKFGY